MQSAWDFFVSKDDTKIMAYINHYYSLTLDLRDTSFKNLMISFFQFFK